MIATLLATITIGIDPFVELGPVTLAWHGIMTAVGILVGGWLATRNGRERGLDTARLQNAVVIMAVAGIVGARVFYLVVAEPGSLLRPGEWLGTRGFAIYGAVIASPLAAWVYLRRTGLGARYLDALAAGFPLGLAVGRIGDVINGEHYGPATDVPWAFRYTHPDADVPSALLAYHSGGFYEVLLGLAMFALVWPLRHRFQRPLMMLWTVVGLYGAGRFAMFFYRVDSEPLALGLNEAQWTSLALVAVAAFGALWSIRRPQRRRNETRIPPPATTKVGA
ncbi:MAG: prolipoprotein diacylglyceryl transferase [Thermoleophilaceae bacterium]|nr:prolipoprotein diacylglyceryl transferase [Thermoleophilaceae bacterium]